MQKILVQFDGSNFYNKVKRLLPQIHLTNFNYSEYSANYYAASGRIKLDKYFGFHFQPKLNNSGTPEMAKVALQVAEDVGVTDQIGVASVVDTPAATEFQDYAEA